MSNIKAMFFHINAEGKFSTEPTLDAALAAAKKEGFIWLNYCKPTREDLLILVEPLGLHPLAIEDCTDDNQIPKIEDYPDHTFLLFNSFHYLDGVLIVDEIDFFIGINYLVTVSQCAEGRQLFPPNLEHFSKLELENVCQGPAFLAQVILDRIVDQKFVAIEALEENLNTAEDTIMESLAKFKPNELLILRRDLLSVRKSLFHEREILLKISRSDSRFISAKALLFYRDIYDHLAKFFELTESYRDIVTSLMEMYLTMLNNQMAKAANDTNAVVRRLTFITTIFMPLTLLAGIGGMSEWSMITGPQNWRIAYPAFLLAMIIIGVANYFLLRWLEKRNDKR